MKSSEIKIDTELNERLWNRGITKPPRRITVKMEKDEDGVVTVMLPEEEKIAETTEPVKEDEVQKESETEVSSKSRPAKVAEAPKKTKRKPKAKA